MLCAIPIVLSLTLAGGGGAPDPLPWDGRTFRRYEDKAARVAFEVPLTQTLVESRHFTPDDLAAQATDVLMLSGPVGYEVEIDVFQNPRKLALDAWVGATLPFLLTPGRGQRSTWAAKLRVPAELLWTPRMGQQLAHRTAVFASGDRVYRVTCFDDDDPRARAVFQRIVETLEEPGFAGRGAEREGAQHAKEVLP